MLSGVFFGKLKKSSSKNAVLSSSLSAELVEKKNDRVPSSGLNALGLKSGGCTLLPALLPPCSGGAGDCVNGADNDGSGVEFVDAEGGGCTEFIPASPDNGGSLIEGGDKVSDEF